MKKLVYFGVVYCFCCVSLSIKSMDPDDGHSRTSAEARISREFQDNEETIRANEAPERKEHEERVRLEQERRDQESAERKAEMAKRPRNLGDQAAKAECTALFNQYIEDRLGFDFLIGELDNLYERTAKKTPADQGRRDKISKIRGILKEIKKRSMHSGYGDSRPLLGEIAGRYKEPKLAAKVGQEFGL